jgi:DNA-binding MarR family transcriptional regulator
MASRGAALAADELAAWHGLLRTHALVVRALDEKLARQHGLAVSEFDVLITLANAPGQELRMSELADAVMLSPSGLTRLVGRLERAGFVARRQDASDARSFRTSLTTQGRRALDEARKTHNAVIRELYLDRLSPSQHKALGRVWEAVHPDRRRPN